MASDCLLWTYKIMDRYNDMTSSETAGQSSESSSPLSNNTGGNVYVPEDRFKK